MQRMRNPFRADKLALNVFLTVVITVCVQSSPVRAQDVGTDSRPKGKPAETGYTMPSIKNVLGDLHALDPIPLPLVQRQPPDFIPPNRVALAFGFGGLIADGFLNVAAQNKDALVPLNRALRQYANSLGVGKTYSARASSLAVLAQREKWSELEQELINTQQSVEAAMKTLHDEELARLVSLGGWMRALQIASTICVKWPTPERLALLKRPELADYFIHQLESLPHSLAKRRITARTLANLKELRPLLNGPFTPERVRQIHKIAMDFQVSLEQRPARPGAETD